LGDRKDIQPEKIPVLPICRGSLPQQAEKEDPRWNRLIQVHLEKWPLNGTRVVDMIMQATAASGGHSIIGTVAQQADKQPVVLHRPAALHSQTWVQGVTSFRRLAMPFEVCPAKYSQNMGPLNFWGT